MQESNLKNNSEKVLLDWSGHPLVDVGIATLCAIRDKDDPRQLTLEDLDLPVCELTVEVPRLAGDVAVAHLPLRLLAAAAMATPPIASAPRPRAT